MTINLDENRVKFDLLILAKRWYYIWFRLCWKKLFMLCRLAHVKHGERRGEGGKICKKEGHKCWFYVRIVLPIEAGYPERGNCTLTILTLAQYLSLQSAQQRDEPWYLECGRQSVMGSQRWRWGGRCIIIDWMHSLHSLSRASVIRYTHVRTYMSSSGWAWGAASPAIQP